jgi:hypothetical protein
MGYGTAQPSASRSHRRHRRRRQRRAWHNRSRTTAITRLDAQRLETVLRAFFQLDQRAAPPGWLRWLRRTPAPRVRSTDHQTTDSKSSSHRTVDG